MIRVVLPYHLRMLAKVDGEVSLEAGTLHEALDALEAAHPVLRGTIRGPAGRRPFLRFFACQEDLTHGSYDEPLPAEVLAGREPLLVVGAMAGG